MLRAASPENRPALEQDKPAAPKEQVDASAAYLLADAFFGEKGAAAAAARRGGGDGGGRGDAQGRDGAC